MQKVKSIRRIDIGGVDQTLLLGFEDKFLKKIVSEFAANITVRGSQIIITGDDDELEAVERVFSELIMLYQRNRDLRENDIDAVLAVVKAKDDKQLQAKRENGKWEIILYTKDSVIRPKSAHQAQYVKVVENNDLVFAIGPAGTGKTYLAVAIAIANLRDKKVARIMLARPAVEAGESLGFLPGDLLDKVDPYLRPLYDALGDMLPADKLQRYIETRIIEVVPLAYMRGRTLNNAFVILDEAQNTTPSQMKMFLTRLGINSKAIVTGDITQIDLPAGTESGLIQAKEILVGIPGVAFVMLNEDDVVRHRLVRDIIIAYEKHEHAENNS